MCSSDLWGRGRPFDDQEARFILERRQPRRKLDDVIFLVFKGLEILGEGLWHVNQMMQASL